jgi:transcriptional regulator with XRE-family HTH domain
MDNTTAQIVGRNIRKRREQRRLTQGELAAEAGIGFWTLSRIERAEVPLSVERCALLARLLFTTPADLHDPDYDPDPNDPHPVFGGAETGDATS